MHACDSVLGAQLLAKQPVKGWAATYLGQLSSVVMGLHLVELEVLLLVFLNVVLAAGRIFLDALCT
jgi:hypothetical protein